jgi:hypothetical protein
MLTERRALTLSGCGRGQLNDDRLRRGRADLVTGQAGNQSDQHSDRGEHGSNRLPVLEPIEARGEFEFLPLAVGVGAQLIAAGELGAHPHLKIVGYAGVSHDRAFLSFVVRGAAWCIQHRPRPAYSTERR